MPNILQSLDHIAREKQRDVLFLSFHKAWGQEEEDPHRDRVDDWRISKMRLKVIRFLEKLKISHKQCYPPQPTDGTLWVARPYKGELYVDLLKDENNPLVKQLVDFLENPDGSMKLNKVIFWYYALEEAMENEVHDKPGFWDRF